LKPPYLQIGDHVYGRISAARHGAAAQYTLILPEEAAHVPKGMSMIEAASVPMSAHTAWQALFEQGLLTGSFTPMDVPHVNDSGQAVLGQASGKRVLILGAAGGVGLMAVQFAKLAGAHVSGTSSTRNITFLTNLGIDEVIDYTRTTIPSYIRTNNPPFDLVLDCVGGTSMLDGWHGVAPHGTYISVVPAV
jgi:NADPH:quinone reductase-like Zn-dependent oxidoreductase